MTSIDREERQPEADVMYADGLDIRLLNLVKERLNASVRFLPLPDGEWWTVYINNTWSGIAGDVVYGRADVGMCGKTYEYAMSPDLECTVPYDVTTFGLHCTIRSPGRFLRRAPRQATPALEQHRQSV